MGADTSSTHLIFFIAAMVIAAGVVSVIFTSVTSIVNSSYVSSSTLSNQLETDITIINDPNYIPKNGNIYTFYIKNTGKSTLSTEYVSVLIEGEYILNSDMQKTVIDGISNNVWHSAEILQININHTSMLSGDNTIRVVAENGVDDSLKFTIA